MKNQESIADMFANEQEISKIKKARKSEHEQARVYLSQVDEYKSKGWIFDRQTVRKAYMRKPKPQNKIFEDRVWCLFADMGFKQLNRDYKCEIPYVGVDKDTKTKTASKHQIDVIAIDDECVLIIECKSAEKEGTKGQFKKEIESIQGYRKGIIDTLKKEMPELTDRQFLCALATNNYIIGPQDKERLATENIFHLDEQTISYYQELTKNLGSASKYQFMAHVFEGRKIKCLTSKIPAIRGKMGGYIYYSFSIEPHSMLKISYVLHRNKSLDKHMPTYQRIIKRKRLTEINTFLNKGGFFPNSILVNITTKGKKSLSFESLPNKDKSTISQLGYLSLPQQYGCAYIIDGQHRLFGYAHSKYSDSNTIPVVLFENLEPEKQVQLFMQINENQKAVSKQLRHLLNADLLIGDAELKNKVNGEKLRVAICLGEAKTSMLKDYVLSDISVKTDKRTITIDAIKEGLDATHFFNRYTKNSKLIEDGLLVRESHEDTIDLIYSYLEHCFNYIAENATEEWIKAKGSKDDKGILTTNHGIGGLIRLFDDILLTMSSSDNINIKLSEPDELFSRADYYLQIFVRELALVTKEQKEDLRKYNGAGAPTKYWHTFQQWILSHCDSFIATGLDEYKKNMSKQFNAKTREHLESILHIFRELTVRTLKSSSPDDKWEFSSLPNRVLKSLCDKLNLYKINNRGDELPLSDFLSFEELLLTAKQNWHNCLDAVYTLPGDEKLKAQNQRLQWLNKIIAIHKKDLNTYSVKEDEYKFVEQVSQNANILYNKLS